MKGKILITPRSFAKTNEEPKRILKNAGYELICNPYGKILTKEQMIKEIRDVVGVIIGVDPLDADVLQAAPQLRAIAKYGFGTDNIDLKTADRLGVPVSITRNANSEAVADYAFALMMACARKVTIINDMCHQKDWSKIVTGDIYGKTLGIVGLGAIGKAVARRARGFDMEVLAYDIFWDEAFVNDNNIKKASLQEIYQNCDYISLHMPLTESTRGMLDENAFSQMKHGTVLINTARGGLINEGALIQALKDGVLAGAGIDAFEEEPPKNEEIYLLDNLIMGSHCAASTHGASEKMSMMAVQNLLRDLDATEKTNR